MKQRRYLGQSLADGFMRWRTLNAENCLDSEACVELIRRVAERVYAKDIDIEPEARALIWDIDNVVKCGKEICVDKYHALRRVAWITANQIYKDLVLWLGLNNNGVAKKVDDILLEFAKELPYDE
mgnify:CR=1 FL=1